MEKNQGMNFGPVQFKKIKGLKGKNFNLPKNWKSQSRYHWRFENPDRDSGPSR